MWRTSFQLENFPIKFNQYILNEPSTVINTWDGDDQYAILIIMDRKF